MGQYEVELSLSVRVDDEGVAAVDVVEDVMREMSAGGRWHPRITGVRGANVTVEVELTAASPADAAVAGTVLLHEAAARSHVLTGRVPGGPWNRAIRELGIQARETPNQSGIFTASDTTALAF